MEKMAIICTFLLCAAIPVWWYLGSNLDIDYERYGHLIDPVSGKKRTPIEVMELTKVINYTQEYINSTNAQERLYDLIYQLNLENPFIMDHSYSKKEDLQVSGWPVANQEACGRHLNWTLSQLQANRNYTLLKGSLGYELTNLMDSFGKPETGAYSGVINWLGSYKQCNKNSLNGGRIKTRYCIGKMRPKWWPKKEVVTPKTRIRVGLCLPETCDTQSFDEYSTIIETLAKFQFDEFHKENLEMDSIFCLPDERSPIRQIPVSGHIFIYLICIWLAIIITANLIYELKLRDTKKHLIFNHIDPITELCEFKNNQGHTSSKFTSYESFINKSFSSQILECLSIRCSLKSFKRNVFNVKYNLGHRVRVDLGALDFFKVAMAMLIVLGHSAYLSMVHIRSLSNRIEISTSDPGRLVLSVGRCVDTFYLFFGVLTTYTLMRKFNIKQLSNPITWLVVNLGILLRISPIFMLIFWYSKSISPYTSSGPWWDYGVDELSLKNRCMNEPWWKSIPYLGALGTPAVPSCNLPSWFIISYAHISLVIPVFTYILCKLPNHMSRFLVVAFLTFASTLNISYRMYMQTTLNADAFTLYGAFISDLLEKFQPSGNMTTLSRLGSVSIGCLVGYLLRLYETEKITQWPRWLQSRLLMIFLCIVHSIVIFLPIIGHRIVQYTGTRTSLEVTVISNTLIMLIWPIMNAIVVLHACTVSAHTVVVRFFSHSFWHVFNRLCLCIYLIHWEVIFVGIIGFDEAPTYGFIVDVMKMWAFGMFYSTAFAFVIYLFYEAPLSELLTTLSKSLTQLASNSDSNSMKNSTLKPQRVATEENN